MDRSSDRARKDRRHAGAQPGRVTPAQLAAPLLGGPGRRFARNDRGADLLIGWVLLGLLGASVLIGLLLQIPCQTGGYELPHASFRMCQSPVALAMTGDALPDSTGRITSGLSGFAPLTYWFVVLMMTLGTTAQEAMGFLLVINTAAFAVMGTGVVRLARALETGNPTGRTAGLSWAALACVSPVIVFSLGQSLDPVGVALAVWACALLTGDRSTSALVAVGVLLAGASFASPLGLLVLVGVLITALRDRGNALLIAGGFALVAGLLVLADGRMLARLSMWTADAVDRGSLAWLIGIVSAEDTIGVLIVWVLATIVVAALAASSMIVAPYMAVDPDCDPSVTAEERRALLRRLEHRDTIAHLRQMMLAITALLALAVLLAPGSSTTLSLWLVPFAGLAVRRLPVMLLWAGAELAFAIAVPLSDVSALDSSIGLDPMWMGMITVVRAGAVALLFVLACDDLNSAGRRRVVRRAMPAAAVRPD